MRYYVIEFYQGSDMTIRDVHADEFIDAVRQIDEEKGISSFSSKDCVAIQRGKMLTTYFACENKRNDMVVEMLNKGYKKMIEHLKRAS